MCTLLLCPGRTVHCCDEHACFVYVSVCMHISGTIHSASPNFLFMLSVAMVWLSSGNLVIRYVLPVLWMMSCFPVIGPMVV